MKDCRPISTPMDPNTKLSTHDDSELVEASKHRKLVGSLIWLLNTQVDLSYSVGLLVGFMSQPRKTHWQAGLQILRYLRAILNLGLFYSQKNDEKEIVLTSWLDSNWPGDYDTRRSP